MDIFKEKEGRSLLYIVTSNSFNEPFTLVDESGVEYTFEKVWYKPTEESTYCVFRKLEGEGRVAGELFIFYFVKLDRDLCLRYVVSERTCNLIIKEFYEATAMSGCSFNNLNYRKQPKASVGESSNNAENSNSYDKQSKFTGGAFANFFIHLGMVLVSLITLGLAFPIMYCIVQRWVASHTYVDGKQMEFDGNGGQLFGKMIVWALLSIITLGIYLLLKARLLMIEWVTSHTHFVGEKNDSRPSKFDGKWYQIFGVSLLTGFVTLITLSFGMYWAHCYTERWYCKHQVIDGHKLCFDGTGMEYFCKRIVWTLLTIVTLGVYSFWLAVKSKKWTVSHTHIDTTAKG